MALTQHRDIRFAAIEGLPRGHSRHSRGGGPVPGHGGRQQGFHPRKTEEGQPGEAYVEGMTLCHMIFHSVTSLFDLIFSLFQKVT